MKRKCKICGEVTKDDRLIVCPECGGSFSNGESDRALFTPQQEKYIISKIWKKHWKFLFGGFSILTIISVALLVFALIKAYTAGTVYLEKTLVNNISKEFEQPRIKQTIEEVAKSEARDVITNQVNPIVENFRAQIEKVKPPTLSLSSRETKKLESGYKITLQFTPSKNEPLGIIIFQASIDDDSDVQIVDFWPSGGAFISGKDSKKITSDGKKARLAYSLMSAGRPKFDLTLSGRARIKIEGNYLENEIIVSLE